VLSAVIVASAVIEAFSFPGISRKTPSVPFFVHVRIPLGLKRQHVSLQLMAELNSFRRSSRRALICQVQRRIVCSRVAPSPGPGRL
jgi:hypothetical protein